MVSREEVVRAFEKSDISLLTNYYNELLKTCIDDNHKIITTVGDYFKLYQQGTLKRNIEAESFLPSCAKLSQQDCSYVALRLVLIFLLFLIL